MSKDVYVEYKHGIIDIPHDSKRRIYKARSVVETPSEYFLKRLFSRNRILKMSVKQMDIPHYVSRRRPVTDFEIVSNSTVCRTDQLHTLTLKKDKVLRLKNTVTSTLYSVSAVKKVRITVYRRNQGQRVIKSLSKFELKKSSDRIIIYDHSKPDGKIRIYENVSKVLVEVFN